MNGLKSGQARERLERVLPPAGLEASTFEVGTDEYCLFELDFDEVAAPSELTRAEREVTRLVLEGRTNEQIATARGTAPSTVANQLQAIFEKLGINGRLELIAHCVERSRRGAIEAPKAPE
jgi:DNA-binding CsgD family transcriptional regulator